MRGWTDRRGLRLLAGLLLVGAVSAVTALAAYAGSGVRGALDGPGAVVQRGGALLEAAGLLLAVHTVGSLLVLAVLAPTGRAAERARAAVVPGATAWALVTVLGMPFAVADSAGLALTRLRTDHFVLWGTTAPVLSAGLAGFLLAMLAFSVGPRTAGRSAVVLLMLAVAAALVEPVAAHGRDADGVGAAALLVHVASALVWTGGLYGLLVHVRGDARGLAVAARRFSALALGAWVALALSGLLTASGVLPLTGPGVASAWSSPYGVLVLGKVGLLLTLAAVGAWQRTRCLPALAGGRPGAFARWTLTELVLMAVALGLAAGLSATPVPSLPAGVEPGHGHADRIDPVGWATLAEQWRPNAVVLLVVVGAAVTYLRRARRHLAWPPARTLAWLCGVVLAGVLTTGGVAVYADLLLSLHLGQLVGMGVVVPALLVLGRPGPLVGLSLPVPRSAAPGAVGLAVLLLLVHQPALLQRSMDGPWSHLLLLVVALVLGLAMWAPLLRDGSPDRAWLLVVALACTLLAWRLSDGGLLAQDFFLERRLRGTDPVGDQRAAAVLAGVSAVTLLATMVALGLRRPRQGFGGRPRSAQGPGGQRLTSAAPSNESTAIAP